MSSEPSSSAAKDQLDAPIVLNPDQIATVAGGTAVTADSIKSGGIIMGGIPVWPPHKSM